MAAKKKEPPKPELFSFVYFTRFALTAGIKKMQVVRDLGDGYLSLLPPEDGTRSFCLNYVSSPKDYTTDPKEAIQRAEAMREKKIAALKKQLAALEVMTFTVPE